MIPGSTNRLPENEEIMKMQVSIEKCQNRKKSVLYRKRMFRVLKRQTVICPRIANWWLCISKKKQLSHATNTSQFSRLEDRAFQRFLQVSVDRIFSSEGLPNTPLPFTGFVHLFSHRNATDLLNFLSFDCQIHTCIPTKREKEVK